jgi:hypothetical protein
MGAEKLAAVKRKVTKLDGEDYEAYIDGVWQCPKRLKREANRQVFTSVIESFTSGNISYQQLLTRFQCVLIS